MVKSRKNVILLTVECLRADHMHYMGYPQEITPTLDKLSKLGLSFSKAMAASTWTPTSFKSIFSSRYPLMDGGILSITRDMNSLPRFLKKRNYSTGAIAPPGWFQTILHEQDFDTFNPSDRIRRGPERLTALVKILERIKNVHPFHKKKNDTGKGRKNLNKSLSYSDFVSYIENFKHILPPFAKFYTQQVNSWIEKNQTSKFFLFAHYPDPHEVYYPSSPFISLPSFLYIRNANKKSTRKRATRKPDEVRLSKRETELLMGLYCEKIKIVDRAINGILKKLIDLDLFKNTYIIITGDHGQEFMEHGGFGHGLHLYNECINVPLLIVGPEVKRKKVDLPVSLIDIAPTVLDLLGYEQSEGFLGSSLLNEDARKKKAEVGVICEDGREKVSDHSLEGGKLRVNIKNRKVALITPEWKYIYKEKGKDELYNIQKDPYEKENIWKESSEIATHMKKRIQSHIRFEKQQSKEWRLEKRIRKVRDKIRGI